MPRGQALSCTFQMKRLTGGPTVVLPPCCDPVKHEKCGCRTLAPLVRSHTLLSRASIMTSRASQRSLRSLSLPRHQMAAPSPPGQVCTCLPCSKQGDERKLIIDGQQADRLMEKWQSSMVYINTLWRGEEGREKLRLAVNKRWRKMRKGRYNVVSSHLLKGSFTV